MYADPAPSAASAPGPGRPCPPRGTRNRKSRVPPSTVTVPPALEPGERVSTDTDAAVIAHCCSRRFSGRAGARSPSIRSLVPAGTWIAYGCDSHDFLTRITQSSPQSSVTAEDFCGRRALPCPSLSCTLIDPAAMIRPVDRTRRSWSRVKSTCPDLGASSPSRTASISTVREGADGARSGSVTVIGVLLDVVLRVDHFENPVAHVRGPAHERDGLHDHVVR